MRKTLMTLALAFAATSAFAAERYEFDPNHRNVRFTFNHFGFSNISGSLEQLDGHVMLDTADLSKSSVEVKMPLSSLHTGVPKFDEHLKSADFFEAAKFPDITFKSTGVKAAGEGKLAVTGDQSPPTKSLASIDSIDASSSIAGAARSSGSWATESCAKLGSTPPNAAGPPPATRTRTGTSPTFSSSTIVASAPSARSTPRANSTCAVPIVGWPANGISPPGVKMRTRHAPPRSGGSTNVVSE
jgi:hypothetical protein